MKNEVLELIVNDKLSEQEKYNKAYELFRTAIKGRSVVLFQYNRGYSPQALKNLIYDLKKILKITDLEVSTFVPTEVEPIIVNASTPEELKELAKKTEQENTEKLAVEDAKKQAETQRLNEVFPFLLEEDCPDVFKILVTDKIRLWNNLNIVRFQLEAHQSGIVILEEKEEQRLSLLAVELFEAEQAINDELVHYKEQKEILGKHIKFKELAIERDLEGKTTKELHQILKSAPPYISKNKKALEKEENEEKREEISERIKDRELLVKLVNKKLGLA